MEPSEAIASRDGDEVSRRLGSVRLLRHAFGRPLLSLHFLVENLLIIALVGVLRDHQQWLHLIQRQKFMSAFDPVAKQTLLVRELLDVLQELIFIEAPLCPMEGAQDLLLHGLHNLSGRV